MRSSCRLRCGQIKWEKGLALSLDVDRSLRKFDSVVSPSSINETGLIDRSKEGLRHRESEGTYEPREVN
jgi:hypothetical protein